MKLRQDNWGVLLGRKLGYSFPNQRAEVFVADAAVADQHRKWRNARHLVAGSNTVVFSNPPEELGKPSTSPKRRRVISGERHYGYSGSDPELRVPV